MGIKTEGPAVEKHPLQEIARAFILEHHVMTLATSGDGLAWAAPLYYLYRDLSFYFFSQPTARHIREALETEQAAAAIHAASSGWQDIRGLQMSGSVAAVLSGEEAVRVFNVYCQRFPFVREFFTVEEALDVKSFLKRFQVRIYRFSPRLVYYLDNGIRFGFRERVHGLELVA